ncbi:hypothetical protein MNBD_GAMMA11-2641 [hydrothermal vent metagenome]|uniref:Uncharacterized protein n=1 Tax=hydrothermal vent metagenome TaxID=652676 RepID=A0A3B0X971_9ZZZZ
MRIPVIQIRKVSYFSLFIAVFNLTVAQDAIAQVEDARLQTAPAQYQVVEQERVLDARVEAVHKATVSAQTSGRVKKIFFDVNDYVKKGDVLLRLRDKDQQAKLSAARAAFKQAESEFTRVTKLYLSKLIAKSVVDKAELQLKSSRARLDQAEENLQRTIVRAPYSGIVVKRHIEVGETARRGMALFTGLSLETLRVVVNLPQDMIRAVRQLKQARVLLKTGADAIEATSMSISPYADAVNHTFQVRVNLPSGDYGLYPGMAVKAVFATGVTRKLLVPASAITHRSEVTAVYVMSASQSLSMRQIRAGHRQKNAMVEVLSGLQENEQVVIDPVRAVAYFKDSDAR